MPELLGGAERHRAPLGARPAFGGRRARAGGLVGIPDLVEAKLLADSIAEDDPLRPTGSSSATRVKAQAGDKGARVLRWTAKDFRRAVDAEKDPKVQAQLIFYLNQQLLKKLHLRDHGVARKEYSNLLRAALSSGQVEAQDRAALHAFRAKNGLTEGDHADCLEALGWTTEAFAVGARLDLEGTTSALRALLAKAAPRSASTSPMKPAAPVDATAKPDALKAPVPALAASVERTRRPRPSSPRPRGSRRTSAAARTRDSASPRS